MKQKSVSNDTVENARFQAAHAIDCESAFDFTAKIFLAMDNESRSRVGDIVTKKFELIFCVSVDMVKSDTISQSQRVIKRRVRPYRAHIVGFTCSLSGPLKRRESFQPVTMGVRQPPSWRLSMPVADEHPVKKFGHILLSGFYFACRAKKLLSDIRGVSTRSRSLVASSGWLPQSIKATRPRSAKSSVVEPVNA